MMKPLICEMCGNPDLIKEDGIFVCQSCGTKYSVEEAKKLMVEGKVDVSGSKVKIDVSDEQKKFLELARRAAKDHNYVKAQRYYEQLLEKDPSSWEATFFSTYYQSLNRSVADVINVANTMASCGRTVFKMIKERGSKSDLDDIYLKFYLDPSCLGEQMRKAIENSYNIPSAEMQAADYGLTEYAERTAAVANMYFKFGDYLIQFFGEEDETVKSHAQSYWKRGIFVRNITSSLISIYAPSYTRKRIFEELAQEIEKYSQKIQKFDPSYEEPSGIAQCKLWFAAAEQAASKSASSQQKSGCYIATAVYGSYDCPEVWTLRRYRDHSLAETWYGRAFIRAYYAISPVLVRRFRNTAWFKKIWKGTLDRMVKKLQNKGYESTPYEDKNW